MSFVLTTLFAASAPQTSMLPATAASKTAKWVTVPQSAVAVGKTMSAEFLIVPDGEGAPNATA